MSTITEQKLSGFRPNLTQNKALYRENYIDIAPLTNKVWICEEADPYAIQNIAGQHPSMAKGITHVPSWNGQIATTNATPKAGLVGDTWFLNSSYQDNGEYSPMGNKVKESLVSNFLSGVKFSVGGNYEYCILNAEAWAAGLIGLETKGFENFQA